MSGADLDLVVRARHAVLDGTLRPCSVSVRDGHEIAEASAGGEPAGRLITRTET
jgi:hypothetical protein